MKGLYVHIPFCKNICFYCDFFKRIPKNEMQIKTYINTIIEELNSYQKYLNKDIVSIYIGGGTPNILSDENLELLLSSIAKFDLLVKEYTIEVNPELLTISQVKLFKKYNINRVSIGAQNFNDSHLEYLGRKHKRIDIINSVKLLKEYGINNINIDLIFAYPIDTISNVKYNLGEFFKLDIPHISYYNLILEEKTKFYHEYKKKKLELLDEDIEASMYELIINTLKEKGYKHYEISNFTTSFESVHNKIYWDNLEYVAVGAGASGYLDKQRYINNHIMDKYNACYKEESTLLTDSDIKNEFMLLGLRKIDGVSISRYKNLYNSDLLSDFDLTKLINDELLVVDGDYVKLTSRGILLANLVFQEFI